LPDIAAGAWKAPLHIIIFREHTCLIEKNIFHVYVRPYFIILIITVGHRARA
jgi:hypothetical protein